MTTSYFDVWKKKMNNNGGSITQSRLNDSYNFYNNNFKEDPSYKLAILRKKDRTIADSELDTRVVNIDTNPFKKKIYLRPKTKVDIGDYIIYSDETYLALAVENNLVSPRIDSEKCNHLLKWIINDNYYETQCIIVKSTRFTLGIKNESAGITEGDNVFSVVLPYNDLTSKIHENQRFLINGEAWKTTKVDFTTTQGLINVFLTESNINTETDDILNGIADGLTIVPHTYTYNIPTTFEVTKDTSVNLVYSIVDENGKAIDYSGVTVTSSSALVQIANTSGSVSISGLDIGTGSMKLSVIVGGVLKEFDIAFEVKTDVVAPIIAYTCNWSTGQTSTGVSLKTYMSSTSNCKETVNGIVDSTLMANYSLDSIGSSLLSTGAITITRKTNTDFLVKNVSVNTSKSFVITFTNSVDNSIIATQVVSLSGM